MLSCLSLIYLWVFCYVIIVIAALVHAEMFCFMLFMFLMCIWILWAIQSLLEWTVTTNFIKQILLFRFWICRGQLKNPLDQLCKVTNSSQLFWGTEDFLLGDPYIPRLKYKNHSVYIARCLLPVFFYLFQGCMLNENCKDTTGSGITTVSGCCFPFFQMDEEKREISWP